MIDHGPLIHERFWEFCKARPALVQSLELHLLNWPGFPALWIRGLRLGHKLGCRFQVSRSTIAWLGLRWMGA